MAKEVARTQQVLYVLAENTLNRAGIMGGQEGQLPWAQHV